MIFQSSRYGKTQLYDRQGTLVFKQRIRHKFSNYNAKIHKYVQGDKLDLISLKYYGNPLLSWAILDANSRYRCELDIPYGTNLIIPDMSEVLKCLKGIE